MDWLQLLAGISLLGAVFLYFRNASRVTRGVRVLLGFLFVLGLALMAAGLHVNLIATILNTSYAVVVLALAVIFQPELRRFLFEVARFFSKKHNSNQQLLIESVVRSISELQEKELGAIIAVERSMSNTQTRESGVLIDGKVAEELLTTIFFDKTPLHDGGVIIRGDRLVAAGCIFPLTQRQDLDRNLGLRHRAGLGITEESDAVAVILSEERGEISIALNGKLERRLTPDQLRQRLTELLVGQTSSRSSTVKKLHARRKKLGKSA